MNQKETIKNSGQFTATDKQGSPIIIEWLKTTLFEPEFAEAMKDVWDLARQAYTPVEMNFLRIYPDVVGTEDYFKPFEPLFKNGLNAVDWVAAEEVMQALLKSHFIFDASTWGPEITAMYAKDICYVVMVKDQQTKALCGFITFMIRSNSAQGDVKVMSFAVDPALHNRGLGKLLISSILAIKPDVKRIFLCTRVTNEPALVAYRAWGFANDAHPILDHAFNLNHWIFWEYKVGQSDILQKTAEGLKELHTREGKMMIKDCLTKKRLNHEPPAAIAERGWRYHHLGIPYTEPRPCETHYEHLKVYVSGFDTSPYGVEWMRFEKDCQVPDIVRTVPHVAFEVDNLDEALKGKEILLEPGAPSGGVRAAMILHDGAPIELIEFDKKFIRKELK